MLRFGAVRKNPEKEGWLYAQNSTPQFRRARALVDPVIQKMLETQNPNNVHVLDIGCGVGDIAAYLATRYGVSVQGMDLAPEMVQAARTRYANVSNVTFQEGNAAQFSFSQRFDVVVSTSTLQWVEDKDIQSAFQCIRRHLKDTGVLVFLVPTYDFPHRIIKDQVAFTPKWRPYFENYMEPQALHRTAQDYQHLMHRAELINHELTLVTSTHTMTANGFVQFTELWCGCFHVFKDEQLKQAFIQDVRTAFERNGNPSSFEQVSLIGRAHPAKPQLHNHHLLASSASSTVNRSPNEEHRRLSHL